MVHVLLDDCGECSVEDNLMQLGVRERRLIAIVVPRVGGVDAKGRILDPDSGGRELSLRGYSADEGELVHVNS